MVTGPQCISMWPFESWLTSAGPEQVIEGENWTSQIYLMANPVFSWRCACLLCIRFADAVPVNLALDRLFCTVVAVYWAVYKVFK